jgi:hypothetical protein
MAAGAVHNGENASGAKAVGAVHNGENASGAEADEGRRSCLQWWKRKWCEGGRRPPELFTMVETQMVRRRPKAAGAVYNGGNASGAKAVEGHRCLQWDSAVFTMGFDARLSVKCAFGAFRHGEKIA